MVVVVVLAAATQPRPPSRTKHTWHTLDVKEQHARHYWSLKLQTRSALTRDISHTIVFGLLLIRFISNLKWNQQKIVMSVLSTSPHKEEDRESLVSLGFLFLFSVACWNIMTHKRINLYTCWPSHSAVCTTIYTHTHTHTHQPFLSPSFPYFHGRKSEREETVDWFENNNTEKTLSVTAILASPS